MENLPLIMNKRIQNKEYLYKNRIVICVGKKIICEHNSIINKCKHCNNIIYSQNNKKIENKNNLCKYFHYINLRPVWIMENHRFPL